MLRSSPGGPRGGHDPRHSGNASPRSGNGRGGRPVWGMRGGAGPRSPLPSRPASLPFPEKESDMRTLITSGLVAAGALALAGTATAQGDNERNGGQKLTATLTGAAEAPAAGDD